jgi:peptide/nickel transport system substrate-binding protein
LNALVSGEIDALSYLSYAAAKTLPSGFRLLNALGGSYNALTMRVDQAPFNDVRVRQALRLMIDRPQFVEIAYDGYAQVANDVFSPYDPAFDHSLHREQDLPKAKSLLKAAGASDLSFQIVAPPTGPGVVESAQVFAQQAKAAGLSVGVRAVTIDQFYGPDFLKYSFSEDYWYSFPYLVQVAYETFGGAPFNETHFNNARYNSLFDEANRTLDKTKLVDIQHEMQMIDFEEGGLIIPVYNNVLDAYSDKVEGFVPYATGEPLGAWGFDRVWFST